MPVRLIVLLTGLLIGAFATGCGGPSQEERQAALDSREKAERNRERADRAAVVAVTCQSQLSEYLNVLSETESRLGVGMSFADYSEQVGDASVIYDRIPFGRMTSRCIFGPGIKAEEGGNAYIDAYNAWNDCIGDFYCDIDSIDPELQDEWSKASRKLSAARASLRNLNREAADAEAAAKTQDKLADEAEAALE
jgi:hypothetical protein